MSVTPREPRIPGIPYKEEKNYNIFAKAGAHIAIGLIYGIWYGIPFICAILILWFIGRG
jgi:asparagine N-glycosylation enzyme membrane subunit Stt3